MKKTKSKSRTKRSLWEMIWLISLLVLGGGLVSVDAWLPKMSQNMSERYALSHYSNKQRIQYQQQTSRYDYDAIQPLTATRLLQSQAYQWSKPEVPVVGEIAIPSVSIHLPIVKGITPYYLSIGAGEMRPEERMGVHNYSLASHNFNDDRILFSPLRHIKKGDKVYMTNGKQVFTYKVTTKKYVAPDHIEVIDEGARNQMTLITCSMSGETRLIVQGPLVKTTVYQSSSLWKTPMNKGMS